MRMLNHKKIQENMASRFFKDRIYKLLFYIAILFSIVILLILLFQIFASRLSKVFCAVNLHNILKQWSHLQFGKDIVIHLP